MAACRGAVSFLKLNSKIAKELLKTSLNHGQTRNICLVCHKQQFYSIRNLTPVLNSVHRFSRRPTPLSLSCIPPVPANSSPPSYLSTTPTATTIRHHILQLQPNNIGRHSFHYSSRCLSSSSSSHHHIDAPQVTVEVGTSLDPFKMMETELDDLRKDIHKELRCTEAHLEYMSCYYFTTKGKALRPLISLLMARACNIHHTGNAEILWQQKIVAMVAEMIHSASLVHDDVIDASDTRRSQPSLNVLYGQRQAVLTGDFILSQASIAVARTNNPRVIKVLASIMLDLINGEFMQLGSKENKDERFAHYFDKTYKKTASLIAKCCQCVAILGDCSDDVSELSFQYGRNLGLAFQIIDDLLDFTSSNTDMGKPTSVDLTLGLATAPVLFAAQEFPELHAMIMRRFSHEGDVEFARDAVDKSNGIEQTKFLATQHSKEAVKCALQLKDSDARAGLIRLANLLLERTH